MPDRRTLFLGCRWNPCVMPKGGLGYRRQTDPALKSELRSNQIVIRQIIFFSSLIAGALLFAGAARYDKWEVVGPGGGGGQFSPTISPHTPSDVLAACDMTGSFISHDGGESWRMFNLGNRTE